MSECIDKHFEEMLHHYELGLLSEEDRYELELHLIECEHCFNQVAKFTRAADMMKHNRKVRDLIKEMDSETPVEEAVAKTDVIKPRFRKKLWPTLVPVSVAAVIVFLFLVLKDWQLEFRPSQEAVAQKNRMAVMHFENLSDPADSLKLGEIISNLLIADLSESHFIQVVSYQRINDLINYMNREGQPITNLTMALELAKELKAKWMLNGNYLQDKAEIIMNMQLVDVASGDIVATEKIYGDTSMTIFSIVDNLSARVKNKLLLPEEARQEADRLVADVTTHSYQAYRHYLEGIEYKNKMYANDAIRSFEQALEYDSTFAMAYYYLSGLIDSDLIYKAFQYIDHVTNRDQYYIRSNKANVDGDMAGAIEELKSLVERYPDEKDAFFKLGLYSYARDSIEVAIEYFNRTINIDPLYKLAYNHLAYCYNSLGDFEQALWAINQYIAVAPNEANPYDTRGDIYRLNGKLDEALASYKKAVEIKPRFTHSLTFLGTLFIYKGLYDSAYIYYRKILPIGNNNERASARSLIASVPMNQGKLHEAVKMAEEGIVTDRMEQMTGTSLTSKYYVKAASLYDLKQDSLAIETMKMFLHLYQQINPEDSVNYYHFYIQILAESGRFDQAEEVLQKQTRDTGRYICGMYNYLYGRGAVELARGNYQAAVYDFERAAELTDIYCYEYMLGQAYLANGQYDRAIEIYEQVSKVYDTYRTFSGTWNVKLHYYLATAYEAVGRFEDAVREYQTFLYLWRDADPLFEEIPAARERLKKLENKS